MNEKHQRISEENSSKDTKSIYILQSGMIDEFCFPTVMNANTGKQALTILQEGNQSTYRVKLIKLLTLRTDL